LKLSRLCCIVLLAGCGKAPQPSLKFYDWEPLRPLPSAEAHWLQRSGSTVWLKAGRVEAGPEGALVATELSDATLDSYRGLSVTACLRFEKTFLAAIPTLDPKAVAWQVAESQQELLSRAAEAGVCVLGLQLDLDAPRSKLGWYGELLAALRPALPRGSTLSITCLPSWFRHPWAFWPVARRCDFLAPLCFGDTLPAALYALPPVVDEASIGALRLAYLYGRPIYAGLPIYSQLLVYDAQDRLVSTRSGLSLSQVQGRSELRLLKAGPDGPSGGSRLVFQVEQAAAIAGLFFPAGFKLVWQSTDAAELAAVAARARALTGSRFQGWALYRLEKQGGQQGQLAEAAGITLGFEAAQDNGLTGQVDVQPRGNGRWLCRATLRNATLFPGRAWPGFTHLRLRIKNGYFVDVSKGQFAAVDWGVGLESQMTPSSLMRADTVDFQLASMPAYDSISSGPLWVMGKASDMQLFTSVQASSSQTAGWMTQIDREVFPEPVASQWLLQPLSVTAAGS
jgi:hypothetical protein